MFFFIQRTSFCPNRDSYTQQKPPELGENSNALLALCSTMVLPSHSGRGDQELMGADGRRGHLLAVVFTAAHV